MQSLLKRRKLDEAAQLCTQILERAPYDKAAWFIKARAEAAKVSLDEVEMEDEGMAELMMDDNATAETARPGTSFKRPMTGASSGGGPSQGIRPMCVLLCFCASVRVLLCGCGSCGWRVGG